MPKYTYTGDRTVDVPEAQLEGVQPGDIVDSTVEILHPHFEEVKEGTPKKVKSEETK